MARIESLEMRGISKSFLEVKANRDINLKIHAGEILGLLGENGAGKTTLMNILYGLYLPDEGEILINGDPVHFKTPRDSMRAGIGMIHQHFMLVEKHTVLENFALGAEDAPFFFPHVAMEKKLSVLSSNYGLTIDPDKPVWNLSAGEQQRVEIIKALSRNADLLIMDEPTSVLTPQETEELFIILKNMAEQGHSIILISHKLEEILSICDRVEVLRKGRVTGQANIKSVDKAGLARMMIGRQIATTYEKASVKLGNNVMVVKNLHVVSDRGIEVVKGINMNVRSGEILGIAGVSGNGQQEFVDTLTGLRHPSDGMIEINGAEVHFSNARMAHNAGIAHVPEERIKYGVVSNLALYENSVLKRHRESRFGNWISMKYNVIKQNSKHLIHKFQVDAPSIQIQIKNLSGGNIQKLLLGREISSNPKLLIAMHPTYGLDVGATEYVRKQMIQLRDTGGAVLLVSEDLDELYMVCDRIAVIFSGKIIGELTPADWNIDKIGLMMAGIQQSEKGYKT